MPRKILIVDDNKIDRAILVKILEKEYTIVEAENGKEALSILINNPYNISAVLVDAVMPVMDGYTLIKKIRAAGFLTQLPIIVATGNSDKDSMLKAMNCGANNYIQKPYDVELLRATVKNNVHLRETAAIVNIMQKDKLTGVYNREAFMKEAGKLINRHEAGYYIMSSFNIDQFKVINDQYGTDMGDKVLKYLASVISEGLSSIGGICSRISGDKFAVLYPAQFQDSDVIEKILKKASYIEGFSSLLSFCIGCYLVTDLSLSPSIMYDRAELAGETIKTHYETRIAYYDEQLRERLINEQRIVNDMERALATGEFEPWFQPQHNHSTGALIGSEALVRWRKNGQIVPPGEFIPIFEKNGFIYQIDKAVWRQVCAHLRCQLDNAQSPLPVSVNISRFDLFQKDFCEIICGLVREYDLPIDLLRLEITESAFSESPEQIITIVTRLVEFGFIVEIDDFGSGYSSLNTLKDVPAQVIKLDMRFFESGNSQRGGNIVESVVRMAKWLGMAVIAEGIEKTEQADYLRSIGCNFIQGYLYAKPMPLEQFVQYCNNYDKDSRLLSLETLEHLDQNSFWDSGSIDTLIFNTYVGSSCILEYTKGRVEMLRATKHYIEMFGNKDLQIEDVIGTDWGSYMDTRSFCRFSDAVTESKETKETVYGEYEFCGLPGCTGRTVIRGGVRVIATSGDRWLIYCISENITAQREAEENEKRAIRNREQAADQMQAILDNVDVGVIATIFKDDVTEMVFANEKYYALFGYTKEQFQTEIADPYMTITPEERQKTKAMLLKHINSETSGVIESTILRRDGSKRLVRNTYSACHFSGIKEPVQLFIFRDITEEREAELKQKRSAEETGLIMKNVNCGICAIDMKSKGAPHFIFANEQFYSVAGYTKEQARAEVKSFMNLIHPEDHEKVKEILSGPMSSETAVTFDFRCIKRDGSVIFLKSSITFADITGYGKVAILVQTDITETILSKQNAQHLANQLEVIINNTADSITAISTENGIPRLIFANDRHYEQLGATKEKYAEQYEGKTDYILEEDRERVANLLFHADSIGKKTSVEFRIKRTDGAIRWMRSNISVVSYPGIEGPVQLAVTSDITEQVEAVLKEKRFEKISKAPITDMDMMKN